jgi:hypothetical protein
MHRLPILFALPLTLAPLLTACELLLLGQPAAPIDGGGARPDRDECDDDDDCNGGEECDDGDCVNIANEGEGEGEGEPEPEPLPVCSDVGCPEILSFSSNLSNLTEFETAVLSAVVTDPDGVADLIGGVLLDPVSDTTYATFSATGSGTFTIAVGWGSLNPVRPIDVDVSASRVVRARFFDQAGHESFADLTLTLRCSDDDVACDGQCGAERCGGACLSREDLRNNDNCGSCGNQCEQNAFCEFDGVEATCRCPSNNCGPPPEPTPGTRYTSGAPEDGVVCGDQTCETACCLALDQSVSCDVGDGTCFFPVASCDGPEDCLGSEECCVSGFQSVCQPTGQCRTDGNREVCVDDDDCAGSEICCTDNRALNFGLDGGVCAIPDAGQCPDLSQGTPP